jgi:carboxypeptidase Taq
MNQSFKELLMATQEIAHLIGIQSLLHWDQETYLPSDSISARSQQIAVLARFIHQNINSPKYKTLIEKLIDIQTGQITDLYLSEKEKIAVQGIFKEWKKNTQLPVDFVVEFEQIKSHSYHAWRKAKEEKKLCLICALF